MKREWCATVGKKDHSVVVFQEDSTRWQVVVDGRAQQVDAVEVRPGRWSLLIDGVSWLIDLDERKTGTVALAGATETPITLADARRKRLAEMAQRAAPDKSGVEVVGAPIAGKVIKLLVKPGAKVKEGQGMVVLEAMKMENEIRAGRDATVKLVHVEPGQSVEMQAALLTLE